jgi:hypothetical protein
MTLVTQYENTASGSFLTVRVPMGHVIQRLAPEFVKQVTGVRVAEATPTRSAMDDVLAGRGTYFDDSNAFLEALRERIQP